MPQQINDSFAKALTLTKSDTVNNPQFDNRYPDAIWCGEAGAVQLVFGDGAIVAFTVAVGKLPVSGVVRINSTSTAGTLFVGLWNA